MGLEQVNGGADHEEGQDDGREQGQGLDELGPARQAQGLFAFGGLERGHLLGQPRFIDFLLQLNVEPVGALFLPGGGQAGQLLGGGGAEAVAFPEGGAFEGLRPHDALAARHGLEPFPEFGAEMVRKTEVREGLAVDAAFAPNDLEPDGAEQAAGRFEHLELGQAMLQFGRRQGQGLPHGQQGWQIFDGGPANVVTATHGVQDRAGARRGQWKSDDRRSIAFPLPSKTLC